MSSPIPGKIADSAGWKRTRRTARGLKEKFNRLSGPTMLYCYRNLYRNLGLFARRNQEKGRQSL